MNNSCKTCNKRNGDDLDPIICDGCAAFAPVTEHGCPFDEAGTVGEEKKDTCQKCGAGKAVNPGEFTCRSFHHVKTGYFNQSELCEAKCALAAAQAEVERLRKVEEAAKEVIKDMDKVSGGSCTDDLCKYCNANIDNRKCSFSILRKLVIRKAVEG